MSDLGPAKPFLRWAGSKRQLVPQLASYWPGGKTRYVEPFAGSACLFFHLQPESAVIADINVDLIRTYEVVRDAPDAVASLLLDLSPGENEYYMIRGLDPDRMSPVERTCRFIYLNRYSFNGIYRTNSSGRFNVPYGARKSGSLPTLVDLQRCATALERAELRAGDFESTVADVGAGDFVYLDPPFALSATRSFRQYHPNAFGVNDLTRLKNALRRLDATGARFLVSYAAADEARDIAEPYTTAIATVRRNVAGFTSKRRTAKEWLITNRQGQRFAAVQS